MESQNPGIFWGKSDLKTHPIPWAGNLSLSQIAPGSSSLGHFPRWSIHNFAGKFNFSFLIFFSYSETVPCDHCGNGLCYPGTAIPGILNQCPGNPSSGRAIG